MRRHLHRALTPAPRRTLARLVALSLAATAGLAAFAAPAHAATLVRECKAASVSCIAFSGYTGRSVWGYPVNSTGNNCVNYAAYRLSRNGVPTISGLGSGGSWASNARKKGYRVDATPTTGSIAQWNYGSAYAPSQGHVGYVEEVTSSYIVISDSAWSGYSSRMRIPKGDRNWPSNFIHFKDQAYLPPPSGTFVKVRESGEIYRLVGRAPVYVSTWTAFGGNQPTHLISSTSLSALPARPANGTFIKGAQRGEIYRIAGGAPVYVSTWSAFGGNQPVVVVDQLAIDKAGTSTQFNHLRFRPQDGTILSASPTASSFRVSAGAPVPTQLTVGAQGVDKVAIQHAGDTRSLKWTHLAKAPTLRTSPVTVAPIPVVTRRWG
jgi:surface antigen